jgi:hypothetical protein
MNAPHPLRRREDLHLEFKSAEALARPEAIGREVAAMLNADGGEVWIGIREENGTAVEAQSIPDPERAAESLLDSLVDRLNPSPSHAEVQVKPVKVEDKIVLRIDVVPSSNRQPYALIKSGGWHFPRRIGNRIRAMSREEVFNREPEADLEDASRRIREERERIQEAGRDSMYLLLEPACEVAIDVSALADELRNDLLNNPARIGFRRIDWHFAQASEAPRLGKERVQWGWGFPEPAYRAEVRAHGAMLFECALGALHWKGEEREIWPLCLLEYPISAFRLARLILQKPATDETPIIADMAFFGIRGWKLRQGSPLDGSLFRIHEAVEYPEPDQDLTWAKPLVFPFTEIRETPDRCGFRLVRRVYEAFGLPETAIPREYDRESGRLVLPE